MGHTLIGSFLKYDTAGIEKIICKVVGNIVLSSSELNKFYKIQTFTKIKIIFGSIIVTPEYIL